MQLYQCANEDANDTTCVDKITMIGYNYNINVAEGERCNGSSKVL